MIQPHQSKISIRFLCLFFAIILLSSCGQKSYTIPRTVKINNTFKKKAIVFIHGLTGSASDTWKNQNSKRTFFEILKENYLIDKAYDIYPINYPSSLFNDNLSIEELGDWFAYELKNENIVGSNGYNEIIFIAHSLGNLVLRSALNTNQTFFHKNNIRLIISLASPSQGAKIANLIKILPWNSNSLSDLSTSDNNLFLSNLNETWDKRKGDTIIACAYETYSMPGVGLIVSKNSATRVCTKKPYPALKNHSEIAKPLNEDDRIAIWVTNEILNIKDLKNTNYIEFKNAYRNENDNEYTPSSKELGLLIECIKEMDYNQALEFITSYNLNKNFTMTCKDLTTLMRYVFYSDSWKIIKKFHSYIGTTITNQCIEEIRENTNSESYQKSIRYLFNTSTN